MVVVVFATVKACCCLVFLIYDCGGNLENNLVVGSTMKREGN